MRASLAFSEIGYRIEDGDIGYTGNTHLSFAQRELPHAAHVRVTPTGSAAARDLVSRLRERFAGRPRYVRGA
jgi:hypothetical protein